MTDDRAFPETEYRERMDRARRAIAAAGIDACVCVAPELLCYFAGYDGHTQFSIQALVFGPDGGDEPSFVFRDVDRGNAEDSCWLSDLRAYHHGQSDPLDLILAAVRERAGERARIGVCWDSYAMPGAFALRLAAALAPAEIVDATRVVEPLRWIKSAREMAYIRRAAAFAEAGLEGIRAALAPGLTEIQLAGRLEAAVREAGSEYSAMPTWLATGARTRGSHRTPTDRRIAPGEPLKTEFAGICRRYHAVTMQTLWLGEPSPAARRAYEGALAGLRAGMAEIAAGVPVGAAEDAAFAAMAAAGIDVSTQARFGYGVSIGFPPSWLEGLDITRESDSIFEPGMTFVLHTNATSSDGCGVLIGGAYALTDAGLETLSGGDLELRVV
ncbi:MAG: aminopeptidase P family protein [Rhodospirillaceae bacterium]|jgi:Xaa-Pro dipeptidase|nr:aminopeptidase P family protein [Rhodospirillaceae bacterium]